MMRAEIDASGSFARLAEDEERRFLQRGRKAVNSAVRRLRNAVRRRFAGSRSGRVYTIDGRQRQASAPGESPASITRKLRNSIRSRTKIMKDRGVIQGDVAPRGDRDLRGRAYALEFGDPPRMEARPYLRPAELEQRAAMERDLEETVMGGES